MSNSAKIRAILEAWLDYIYLEDLSQAEVEVGKEAQRKVWDREIQLVGDRLLIGQAVFQELGQTAQALAETVKQQEFKIATAFPQIYRVEKGERKFKPLFTLDISSIFQGSYRRRGWDLTEFEFQPVIPNLMELYQLDEEEAEKLVTREGLKVFLETTFNYPFATLQDFLERLPLPSSLYAKPAPYLLRFDFVPYNYNLKKDLQKIREQEFWDWASPRHPAYEYLFGQPKPPRHDVLFLGAFPTEAPNESQANALKHARENPLTAVIGPPGNGKTTLLLFVPAQQVVKRAYHLASTGRDASNLTLIASTNNRAVTNVIDQLSAELGSEHFYLEGGRSELIERQAIPKLQAAIDWLEAEVFAEAEWTQTARQLVAIASQLQSLPQQEQERARQRERDLQDLAQLEREIQALTDQIEAIQQQLIKAQLPDSAHYPLEAYQQILPILERASRSLPPVEPDQLLKQANNWWQRLWYSLQKLWQHLTRTSTRQILRRLHHQVQAPLTATLATPFPFQLPLTRESLEAAQAQVASQLAAARQRQSQSLTEFNTARLRAVIGLDKLGSKGREDSAYLSSMATESLFPRQLKVLSQQLEQLRKKKERLEQRLANYPAADVYTRFPRECHPQQQQLFALSWQYLQQEALRRKEEVIASLKIYIDVISSEWNYDAQRRFANNWSSILRDVSLLFPVFASTLQSVRNLLPYPDSGCLDCAVIDEAGMIPPHQVFPVLVRSRSAVVVGDPLQLEPIVPFSQSTIEQYDERAFKGRGLRDSDYERYSPTATYTATAYHRAAGATGQLGDLGQGILLKEHYRCVPPIIQYCQEISGYDLAIKTPEKASKLGPNLLAYQVEGTVADHTNLEEVEAVECLIGHLLERGYAPDEIGVISPYRAQADALSFHLLERYPDLNRDSIGTVHTFQGGQKTVIVLSTRQCREIDSFRFINRRPNLLNTAVSRARELLILVGNLERLRQAGGYIGELVEQIQQYGEVRELP